jgi:hypothetical protein
VVPDSHPTVPIGGLSGRKYYDGPNRRYERDERGARGTDEPRRIGERIGPEAHRMCYPRDHEARSESVNGISGHATHFEQRDQYQRKGHPLSEVRVPSHGKKQPTIAAVANGDVQFAAQPPAAKRNNCPYEAK